MHWRDIIRRPIITEKSNMQSDSKQYAFVVHGRANKLQVASAIELAWPGVKVDKVRIANMPPKRARRLRRISIRKPGYKKAIVTLEKGTIDIFEGVSQG